MERLPVEGQQLIPVYFSSSLSAVAGAREQVLNDMSQVMNNWGFVLQALRAYARLVDYPDRLIDRIRGREALRSATAVVFVPLIRHFPENYNPEKGNTLTIHDPTLKLEVKLPDETLSRGLKLLELNMDPTLVKER